MGQIKDGVYYGSNGQPTHRGVVHQGGKIYYAGENGVLAKDCRKIIHHGMSNGILHHGSYYFDKDGVCDLESFQKENLRSERKKKKKTPFKLPKLSNSQKIMVACFAVAIVIVATLVIVSVQKLIYNKNHPAKDPDAEQSNELSLDVPGFEDDVYLCSGAMKQYYIGEKTLQEVVASGAKAYGALEFKYKVSSAKEAILYISENSDLSRALSYVLDLDENSISIDNLLTNTKYFYRVVATGEDGESKTSEGSFKTANTNRFLSFDGVYNTRDIGGYDTIYGRKVKQGVLIRGSELDGLVESSCYLKDASQTEAFGFAYDLDLRSSSIFNTTTYASRLGEGVGHKFYNSPAYSNIFKKSNVAALKAIFTDLAKPENYPMYLHGTYGLDRTGTVVFLLQGLLGVSEEDIMKEFELSGFVNSSFADGSYIRPVISGLAGVKGSTLNEKIENYMIETVGLTKAQIQSIRDIFLEK